MIKYLSISHQFSTSAPTWWSCEEVTLSTACREPYCPPGVQSQISWTGIIVILRLDEGHLHLTMVFEHQQCLISPFGMSLHWSQPPPTRCWPPLLAAPEIRSGSTHFFLVLGVLVILLFYLQENHEHGQITQAPRPKLTSFVRLYVWTWDL